jgi:hypothetical protein
MRTVLISAFLSYLSIKPQNTVPSLVVKIKELMGNLDKDTMAKACRGFHTKIEAVLKVKGDLFKKKAR